MLEQLRDISNRISDLANASHVEGKMDDRELVDTLAAWARLGYVLSMTVVKFADNLDTIKNVDTRVTQRVAEAAGAGGQFSAHMVDARKTYLALYEAQRRAARTGVRQIKEADQHFGRVAS